MDHFYSVFLTIWSLTFPAQIYNFKDRNYSPKYINDGHLYITLMHILCLCVLHRSNNLKVSKEYFHFILIKIAYLTTI